MNNKDYYKILGIDKNASKEDIKKAYRKLAHEYHPDKGGNAEKFKEVNEAYSVLGNDEKKAQYDQYGQTFSGGQGGYSGFNQGFGGFDFSGFQNASGGQNFEFDLGDIFGDIFGGGRTQRKKQKKGRDIQVDMDLTFSESIFGTEKTILFTKPTSCKECGGTGAKKNTDMVTCSVCNGIGKVVETKRSFFGVFNTEKTCDRCSGLGKIPKEKCQKCGGDGIVREQEEIKVKIPFDVEDGESIRLSGAGEAIKGGINGDLYIRLHVKNKTVFEREGKNLFTILTIKLSEAILGAKYNLETLDGQIELKIPEEIAFGETLRIKGKGIPMDSGKRGDLLVKINIKIPTRLSRDAKKAIEELKKEGI